MQAKLQIRCIIDSHFSWVYALSIDPSSVAARPHFQLKWNTCAGYVDAGTFHLSSAQLCTEHTTAISAGCIAFWGDLDTDSKNGQDVMVYNKNLNIHLPFLAPAALAFEVR
eukprot:1158803-Pelagomonas_calceolata.AAC.4